MAQTLSIHLDFQRSVSNTSTTKPKADRKVKIPSSVPDILKKNERKARKKRVAERSGGPKEGAEAADPPIIFCQKLKKDLTKYLNENYRTKSGIRCIYLDADRPGKIIVETSIQQRDSAEKVITQFLSKTYPNDELNKFVVKKKFEVEEQEVELQYSWNGFNGIIVAPDQPSENLCSVGCPVTTMFNAEIMKGQSQGQYGYLTSAHGISMEKIVRDGSLSFSILDQQNDPVCFFENAPYTSVCGPYSLQPESNPYKAVDAAVIKIQDESPQGSQYQFGTMCNEPPEQLERSIQSKDKATPERQVYKTGSASGETVGYIQAADLTENLTFHWNGQAPEDFYCDNVIRIRPAAGHGPRFSMEGDSGAVVYRMVDGKREALGLVSRCAPELNTHTAVTHAVYWSNCRAALEAYCGIDVQLQPEVQTAADE